MSSVHTMPKYSNKVAFRVSHTTVFGTRSDRIPPEMVAKFLSVSEKTVYKWLNDTHKIEPAKFELLQIKALGMMPWDGWQGFYVDPNGALVTPTGFSFTSAELQAVAIIKQLNASLKLELAKANAEIERLKESNVVYMKKPA